MQQPNVKYGAEFNTPAQLTANVQEKMATIVRDRSFAIQSYLGLLWKRFQRVEVLISVANSPCRNNLH
jgi:hypothetical protein